MTIMGEIGSIFQCPPVKLVAASAFVLFLGACGGNGDEGDGMEDAPADETGPDHVDGSPDGLDAEMDAADAGDPSPEAVEDLTDDRDMDDDGVSPREPLFGVTVDDIEGRDLILESLQGLARKPTARIVFDEYMPASYYRDAVTAFHDVSFIMGEILDSMYVQEYSLEEYTDRTREYLDALAPVVDIWEVGNEINGEWLGPGAMEKAAAAYDLVAEAGEPTALTLYFNEDCWSDPDHEMFTWTEANVPDRMKQNLDFVLVSFYEDDCNDIQPDWLPVFERLSGIFPHASLGFGEVGTAVASRKTEYIGRYYGMPRLMPRFIGGFFWWYFRQDMVPISTEYWSVLNEYALQWDMLYP